MLSRFIEYLASERRLSPHTVQAYASDLKQCKAYLDSVYFDAGLEQATYQILRTWIAALAQQGLNSRTISRKIASLKSFYRFLYTHAYIDQNPALQLSSPRLKKALPVFIQERALLNLLDHHAFEDTFEGWRAKLILELLYGTGIRLSELLSLQDHAVDLGAGTLKVLGKRNKERIIPFPASLKFVLEQYWTHRNAAVASKGDLLLVTERGAPCYPMLIYRVVSHYLRAYSHADQYSPHVLRHTFATHLLHKGAALNAIKELLGHESLTATQLYTHHSLKKLQEVFDQAHPRA